MLTLAEASARLGVEHDTLRRQVRLGKLRARKVGPIWTVSEREVARYNKENMMVRRCGAQHPSHPKQVRCEEPKGHTGEHFNSFFMRSWESDE